MDSRERYNGHDRLIAAIPGSRPARPRYRLCDHWQGNDDRARLEQLVRRIGVAEHVRFLGDAVQQLLIAIE